MTDTYAVQDVKSYQDTKTYRQASPERRRQINRYKKECNISDEHMLFLLLRTDLDAVPQEERDNKATTSTAMLVIGVLLLWNSLQLAMSNGGGANVPLIFLSLGSFLLVCFVHFTGMLNPYKRAERFVAKGLKGRPEVPDFVEWDLRNPNKEDRKASKAKQRTKR